MWKYYLLLGLVLTTISGVISAQSVQDLTKSIHAIEQALDGTESLHHNFELLEKHTTNSNTEYVQMQIDGNPLVFRDLPADQWFMPFVQILLELGIASGYRDAEGNLNGLFGPENNVTRAEAIKMALGAAGVDSSSCEGQPTHPGASNHWAKMYVVCAQMQDFGLKNGHGLDDYASRAEVLHYILQAFGADVPSGTPPFADSVSHVYQDDIAYAYSLGIISGDAGGKTFRPNDPVNRAEVAKMLTRAIEKL